MGSYSTPSRRQRGSRSAGSSVLDKLKLGSFLGVVSVGCTRAECTVLAKKTSTYFQKCHCVVTEIKGTDIKISYMNGELSEEWISADDSRIVIDKDETWCAHGRVC